MNSNLPSVTIDGTLATRERMLIESRKRTLADRAAHQNRDTTEQDAVYDAVSTGRAMWLPDVAIRFAAKQTAKGMNGCYLSKGRPNGILHRNRVDDIRASAASNYYTTILDRFQNPQDKHIDPETGCLRTGFSFGTAVAAADREWNNATGYWQYRLWGVRVKGDGIPEYLPTTRKNGKPDVLGFDPDSIVEDRIAPRRWGDVMRTTRTTRSGDAAMERVDTTTMQDTADKIDAPILRDLQREAIDILLSDANLSQGERDVVLMYLAGYGPTETARLWTEEGRTITKNTVDTLYTRALKKMKDAAGGLFDTAMLDALAV